MKNIPWRQHQGKRYNPEEKLIEKEFFYSLIPIVSYKIEFLRLLPPHRLTIH
ncbi:MAG: hypothetical protein R6U46_11105 [Marinilabilia sp.]